MFYRERANLSVQLKDTKTVVGRLESVVGLILHIVAIFLYLIIFDVSFLPSYNVVYRRCAWCTCGSTLLLLYALCISCGQRDIIHSSIGLCACAVLLACWHVAALLLGLHLQLLIRARLEVTRGLPAVVANTRQHHQQCSTTTTQYHHNSAAQEYSTITEQKHHNNTALSQYSIVTIHCCQHSTILQVPLEKTWVAFSSIVLAFAFVFGNSVKTLYESIIYLFVVHPFDVGDKIIVESVTSKVCPLTLASLLVM